MQEGKRSTFEGGLRVPFVVSGPGIKPGSQCDVPVVHWDLLPTLHDLSGSKAPLPAGVDGGSLRDVFARGNKGVVVRGAPGLIFHYTCHYHPPISVIRIGDYKLMRHLNSGEMKLFNVAKDYKEEHDLAAAMPEKVAEMDRIRQQYIDKVDGGRVEDVYAAYIEELDKHEQQMTKHFESKMKKLEAENPPDIGAQKAALRKDFEQKQRELAAKRGINKAQMASGSWRESSKKEAVNSMGVDKKGNVIAPKRMKKGANEKAPMEDDD